MTTIQRPYSLYQKQEIQQAISAYDVIQQMEKSLKTESKLETEEVTITQNSIKDSAADVRLNYVSLETMRDELRDEILSIERAIMQRHNQQAQKLAAKEEAQQKQRAELYQQLEALKTSQSSKEKFQESTRAHQEKTSRLQQEIEQLKSQRTNQQIPSIATQEREVTQASIADLSRQETKITQLQSKIFQLKTMKARQLNTNEVLVHQLTALQETHQSLQVKQRYCAAQTALYTNKMRQKEAQRDETRADYQEIQTNANDLISAKRGYLEEIANEIDQYATAQLDEIKENFRQQLITNQQRLDESLANVRSSNARALENLEEKRRNYYEQVKASRQTQLKQVEEILDDYWRYVNEGTFRIFNTKQQEYLYAADYEPFDDDRRRVFTWRPGNPVNQGDWKLEQSSSGTFCILNKKQGEYLYAADYKPFDDDRRQVFTWRPGNSVNQGDWKLIPLGNNEYRIFNTYQREYLYAGDYKPFDDDRRRVFTWRPGNPIIQGDWKIIKIA
ncbi:MAG: hypothetical protein KDK96_08515 [Chlamydiia bacterium]|nr:hypothetical protein [Chlamydiia bacterium]